jgi:hypothetical protein
MIQVRTLSSLAKVWALALGGAVFLATNNGCQVKNKTTQTSCRATATPSPQPKNIPIPLCNGALSSPAGQSSSEGKPHSHSVTLSWKPAIPASSSPRNGIKGYYVYRSLTSHTYTEGNRMSTFPLPGIQCVDTTVEPQKTYFYVVKAVTADGKKSDSSIEIKAEVPSP